MGFMTYFVGLMISGVAALLLHVVIGWGMHRWRRNERILWQCALSAAVRALPFALAFAPTLLMKRGLGVLIPASIYLFSALAVLPFQDHPLDIDDRRNLSTAATSFIVVWFLASFILFARQICKLTDENRVTSGR